MNYCAKLTLMVFRAGFQVYDWIFPTTYMPLLKGRISSSRLPWLFVGVELTDGRILDKTSHVQTLVNMGILITKSTICADIDMTQIKRCFYLDEKTLKEEEIPTEGITINDS